MRQRLENMQQGCVSCVSMAEEVLGKMLACECIDEDLLNGPPLKRENEKVRQPATSNMCGHFVLSFMESEMSNHIGYGPASAGFPFQMAFSWQSSVSALLFVAQAVNFPSFRMGLICLQSKDWRKSASSWPVRFPRSGKILSLPMRN